jgi:hypothetical protein
LPKKKRVEDRAADLLERMLVLQMYTIGVPEDRIAKAVGRQKAWVNDLVKGIPKGGKSDGGKAQTKRKPTKRSRR